MRIRQQDKIRFWSKVKKTNSCWIWIGSVYSNGYGCFFVDGKNIGANRFSYKIHFNKLPRNLFVCHQCDNIKCVNPKHLFLGTQKDNLQDMVIKGRAATGDRNGTHTHPERRATGKKHGSKTKPENWARGEKVASSKLTKAKILKIRKMYASGQYTHASLGSMFRVGRRTIGDIINKKSWKYV